LNAAQLALRNKPALATHGAQDAAFGNFLSKALQQLLLRLIWAQIYSCQSFSPPSVQEEYFSRVPGKKQPG
jgi:hypothetical protein